MQGEPEIDDRPMTAFRELEVQGSLPACAGTTARPAGWAARPWTGSCPFPPHPDVVPGQRVLSGRLRDFAARWDDGGQRLTGGLLRELRRAGVETPSMSSASSSNPSSMGGNRAGLRAVASSGRYAGERGGRRGRHPQCRPAAQRPPLAAGRRWRAGPRPPERPRRGALRSARLPRPERGASGRRGAALQEPANAAAGNAAAARPGAAGPHALRRPLRRGGDRSGRRPSTGRSGAALGLRLRRRRPQPPLRQRGGGRGRGPSARGAPAGARLRDRRRGHQGGRPRAAGHPGLLTRSPAGRPPASTRRPARGRVCSGWSSAWAGPGW